MVTLAVVLGLKAVAMAEAADMPASEGGAAKKPPADPPAQAKPTGKPAATCPPASFADQAGLSAQEVEVLQSLGARRAALEARALEIDTQSELLAASEKRAGERIAELKRVQAAVESLLLKLDEQQSERIAAMVNVYQKMRAKDAAAVFDGLDDEVLVEVASRMKQSNLAEVMGAMNPEKVRRLTKLLLEQRKLAPHALSEPAKSRPAAPQSPLTKG